MSSDGGFDRFQRELAEAQAALAALEGEVGDLKFDPHDPASVEAAVQSMERMIDSKAGHYRSNKIVGPMIAKSKEAFAAAIRAKAYDKS